MIRTARLRCSLCLVLAGGSNSSVPECHRNLRTDPSLLAQPDHDKLRIDQHLVVRHRHSLASVEMRRLLGVDVKIDRSAPFGMTSI